MKSFSEYDKNNNNNKDIPTPEEVSEKVQEYRENDNRKKWKQLREEQGLLMADFGGWESLRGNPELTENYIQWAEKGIQN